MRRTTLGALLALGGLLAATGTAGADIGDVRFLSIDDDLLGDASSVEVTGQIRCQAAIDYGLIAAVGQDYEENGTTVGVPAPDTFLAGGAGGGVAGDGPAGPDASAEGVGAFGPSFAPPAGISDDSPCSQSLSSYDIVVQQNRNSGDFIDGSLVVVLSAGTSAENGGRGPGPFIGDYLLAADTPNFERRR